MERDRHTVSIYLRVAYGRKILIEKKEMPKEMNPFYILQKSKRCYDRDFAFGHVVWTTILEWNKDIE